MRQSSSLEAASENWTERTAADLASLMVELGRVLKGASFYGYDNPATATLVDRAHRAWQADLARAGPLEITVSAEDVVAEGIPERVPIDHMPELARAFGSDRVTTLRVGGVLSREGFTALVAAIDPTRGEAEVALHVAPGIEVNGIPDPTTVDPTPERTPTATATATAKPTPPPPAAPTAPTAAPADASAVRASTVSDSSVPTSPTPPAPAPAPAPTPAPAAAEERAERTVAAPAPSGEAPGERAALHAATARDDHEEEKSSEDIDPLEAEVANETEAALYQALGALSAATADDAYVVLARRIGELAAELAAERSHDAVHVAMLQLAEHASRDGEAWELKRRVAGGTLTDLAVGRTLDDLILRACSKDPRTSVRAAQILLFVGQPAAWATLDFLAAEPEGHVAPQLAGLLVALAEASAPCLALAIRGGNTQRGRIAIHIAADLQAPLLTAPLREHLCTPGPLPVDAAKALVEIGNAGAVDALLAGLDSEDPKVVEISAYSLGTLGAPQALGPLVERLHMATEDRDWHLVREILSSIGQFQLCSPGTAERLKSWICQPRIGLRRPPAELRLDGITALGQLLGPSAGRALEDIARGKRPRASKKLRAHAASVGERRAAFARSAPDVEPLQ